ncbi:MAG: Alpha/beta hydrolase fold-3 domain protein [Myxococcaceae bacterium]|nr:Alpha/beta hydrolase fold-3 domain protein [Myxococcaceae bacterium]
MTSGTRLGPAELIAHRAAVALCAVPGPIQERLVGGPISRDGLRLEPELHLLVKAAGAITPRSPTTRMIRETQNRGAVIAGGPQHGVLVGAVRDLDLDIAGRDAGPLRARHYAPLEPAEADGGAAMLVFFHGGGFVFGDLDTHDVPCRVLCRHTGAHVLAIDYRLAPEDPFPAGVLDARAALAWAHAHARDFGVDPARIGVCGDSAGANLSAVVAQVAARDGGPAPACQILFYPAIDRTSHYPSLELFADGFYLTRASIDWFHGQYVGTVPREPDARVNPLLAEDLSGLAPTLLVTAGFDPLRDEGEAYARALAARGNAVTVRRFGSLVHGFLNMVGVSPACRDAVIEIAGATRVLLARKPS